MAENTIFRLLTKGSFYDFTVYMRGDQVIWRQRHNAGGKNIKTLPKYLVTLRWTNDVRQYQALKEVIAGLFSDREPNQSEFNKFMQLNAAKSRVYLSRLESRLGATVAEPGLIVSFSREEQSTPIWMELREDRILSNIRVPAGFDITATTTVAEVTGAILQATPGMFSEGDQLAIIVAEQQYSDALDIPIVEAGIRRVQLDFTDDRPFAILMGKESFHAYDATVGGVAGRYLGCSALADRLLTYVHFAHKGGDKWVASTQSLVGKNPTATIYGSQASLQKAIESYGGLTRRSVMSLATELPEYALIFGDTLTGSTPGQGGTGNTSPTPVAKVTVSVVITGENASRGSVSPETVTVDKGTPVTFTATVDTGYKPKWPNNSNALSYTVTPTESMNIALQFIADSGLSVKESE